MPQKVLCYFADFVLTIFFNVLKAERITASSAYKYDPTIKTENIGQNVGTVTASEALRVIVFCVLNQRKRTARNSKSRPTRSTLRG